MLCVLCVGVCLGGWAVPLLCVVWWCVLLLYMSMCGVHILSGGHIIQATPDLFGPLTLSWIELS